MVREVGYKTKPIDPAFLQKEDEFPVTGEHYGHKVRAEGKVRMDGDGKPYPTALGIHGTSVAVDWEACAADGVCMDVCPVNVFEWFLNPGQAGTGKDKVLQPGTDEYNKYRCDKSDPIREQDCIFCMACETSCPTGAIKITSP
ncbi:MAG: ferredoxin family protein [Nitrososphaerota archaeon]